MELISKLEKYKHGENIIEYINPFSNIGEYQFNCHEIETIIEWIKYIDSIIDILLDPEDISIMTNLNVLTTLQIFIYYTKYNVIKYKKPSEYIIACYLLVIILYNEDCNILSKPMMKKICDNIPYTIKTNKIYVYIDSILKFFNYDCYSIPLTINYLTYISDPYDDENYDELMNNIDIIIKKEVLKKSSIMEKNPYDITEYILQKIEK